MLSFLVLFSLPPVSSLRACLPRIVPRHPSDADCGDGLRSIISACCLLAPLYPCRAAPSRLVARSLFSWLVQSMRLGVVAMMSWRRCEFGGGSAMLRVPIVLLRLPYCVSSLKRRGRMVSLLSSPFLPPAVCFSPRPCACLEAGVRVSSRAFRLFSIRISPRPYDMRDGAISFPCRLLFLFVPISR